jgi:hypothetical protein
MPHPSPTGTLPADTTGAMLLAAAVIRQAWLDRISPAEHIRGEAQRFWRNPQAVSFWADALDVDPDRLRHAALTRVAAKGRTAG